MTGTHPSVNVAIEAEYTAGSIAALITVPLLIVALLGGSVGLWQYRRRLRAGGKSFDYEMVTPRMVTAAFVTCVVAAVGTGVLLWWGMFPWKAEYHEWRPVSGTVASVDSRLTPSGDRGSMEDKFVVTFEGDPQQYGVLDTRAAGVREGDLLTITCVRRWQWSGTHGRDCNFVDLVVKR